MYSVPSGIVMNNYDREPMSLIAQKWLGKNRRKKKKRVSESFANYFNRTVNK
jgi:hypothetical protein